MKILIVEDDPVFCAFLARVLSERYETVDYVETAEECLKKCGNYDLVLLDWNLPGMNGVDAAKSIKNRFPGMLPVLILLSASHKDREDALVYACGVTNYMDKQDPDLRYKLMWNVRLAETNIASAFKVKGQSCLEA